MKNTRAFTLVELLASLAAAAVLIALSVPAFSQTSRDGGLAVSLNNVRLIMEAQAAYRVDHSRVPMRGSRYTNGNLSGWDLWNFGGKNCDSRSTFWQTGWVGEFDESAYSRPLNGYIYPDVGIPRPAGYINSGSGSTWTFRPGVPTPEDRSSLNLPIFSSPGDVATYMRQWPYPTQGLSGYDDVGTSYVLNVKWWDMPSLFPLPFTQRFNTGVDLINSSAPSHFVWITDHLGDVVPYLPVGSELTGQFGGINRSVVGFMDGRSEYIELLPNTHQGPGYTLWPSTRSVEARR